MSTVKDFYKVLGVPTIATATQIRKAYRSSALKWHPDKNGGTAEATATFQRIGEAYEVLSSPRKRSAYDRRRGRQHVHQLQQLQADATALKRRRSEESARQQEEMKRRRRRLQQQEHEQAELVRQAELKSQAAEVPRIPKSSTKSSKKAASNKPKGRTNKGGCGTVFCIKNNGEPCGTGKRIGDYCHLHKHQKPATTQE